MSDQRLRVLRTIAGEDAPAIESELTWAKARGLAPASYAEAAKAAGRRPSIDLDQVARHYADYQTAMARRGAIDLDDVVTRATDLIRDDPRFAATVKWRYRHLSVDEFQDINPAQFRLVSTLLTEDGDLTAVGDPDQAIYGWNGADPDLLLDLPRLIAGVEVVRLDQNHRSSPQVVALAAAALGAEAHGRPAASTPQGPLPTLSTYDDETAEAQGVAAAVLRWSSDGIAWSDQAVLARTNEQLVAVADALRQRGVPYRNANEAGQPPARPAVTPHAAARARRAGTVGDGTVGDGTVELTTFHRAKGLEWEAVCIVGLEDGLVPLARAVSPAARAEERRLLYVALTRARVHLACSWSRTRRTAGGHRGEREPSPWLSPLASLMATGHAGIEPPGPAGRFATLRARLSESPSPVSSPRCR